MNISVEYIVSNPYRAILEVEDFDKCLEELTGDYARRLVSDTDFDYCAMYLDGIKLILFENIERKAEQYGIEVLAVHIPTFVESHAIRLIQQ